MAFMAKPSAKVTAAELSTIKIAGAIALVILGFWWWLIKGTWDAVKAYNHDKIAYYIKMYTLFYLLSWAGQWYKNK